MRPAARHANREVHGPRAVSTSAHVPFASNQETLRIPWTAHVLGGEPVSTSPEHASERRMFLAANRYPLRRNMRWPWAELQTAGAGRFDAVIGNKKGPAGEQPHRTYRTSDKPAFGARQLPLPGRLAWCRAGRRFSLNFRELARRARRDPLGVTKPGCGRSVRLGEPAGTRRRPA